MLSAKAPELDVVPRVVIAASNSDGDLERLLPPAALSLVARLHRQLEGSRRALLDARRERQANWDAGATPGFVAHPDSEHVAGDWRVRPLPADLQKRRVEITGPINDSRMVINMLSRGADGARADCAMLDFEDSMCPLWANVLAGVNNLIGAVDGNLEHHRPATHDRPAKLYRLDPEDMAVIMVRCRGLHLNESSVEVDGEPVAAGIFDLAVCAHHVAAALLESGRTPKFYVPKVEHYLEARWWEQLFSAIEAELGLESGVLRATFLIETLPAAFQVEEILYELRNRAAGLNVGRWDKIFSDIKSLKEHPDRVLADRGAITMEQPWMHDYALNLIRTCHSHGAWAMGGMAAFTPGHSAELRQQQVAKVIADKRWEASLGHDGCWVSHPYFIAPAMEAFPHEDQLDTVPELAAQPELLPQGGGPRTLDGLATNVRVGIAYLQGWNRGIGCVAWDNLMEDLATLEISRSQVWQWLRHRAQLDDGPTVTHQLVAETFERELARIVADRPTEEASFTQAAVEAEALFTETSFRPFMTVEPDRQDN